MLASDLRREPVPVAESRGLGWLGERSDRQGSQSAREVFRRPVWVPLRSREHRSELCVSVQRKWSMREKEY